MSTATAATLNDTTTPDADAAPDSQPPPQVSNPRADAKAMPHRWWVSFNATALTPLSVSDGSVSLERIAPEDGEAPPQVNVVIRSHDGKPYIPATGFKGALRAAARQYAGASDLTQRLFGLNVGDKRNPGQVDFHDLHGFTAVATTNLPHAKPTNDGSYVETSTAIDRDRGTVKDQHLFNDERLAPGCSFTGTLMVQAKTKDEGIAIVAELKALFAATAAEGLALGSDRGRGCGRVALAVSTVGYFGSKELAEWMTAGCTAPWSGACSPVSDPIHPASIAPDASHKPPVTLKFKLSMQGLFMVKDPSRVTAGINGQEPDANPALLDAQGMPALPARTLHGALRSQSERILRTMGIATGGAGGIDFDPTKNVGDMLIEALYGSSARASGITQPAPPKCTNTPLAHTQDFIAIDRFTGGGLDGAKFNAKPFYKPEFEVTLKLRLHDALTADHRAAARGLLLLTLRDLAEGDIPLGWGKRKGYGACTSANAVTDSALAMTGERTGATVLKSLLDLRQPGAPESSLDARALVWNEENGIQAGPQLAAVNVRTIAIADRFHNTYHFIPAVAAELPAWLPKAIFARNRTPEQVNTMSLHSHASYRAATADASSFSGEITCEITAQTPFVVAQRRRNVDGTEAKLHKLPILDPYRISGQFALPASTLKGMLGAVAEAASGSAMRVFDGAPPLTYRIPADTAQSCNEIGILGLDAEGLFIRPLRLETEYWMVDKDASVAAGRVFLKTLGERNRAPRGDYLPKDLHVLASLTAPTTFEQQGHLRISRELRTSFQVRADEMTQATVGKPNWRRKPENTDLRCAVTPHHMEPVPARGETLSETFNSSRLRNDDPTNVNPTKAYALVARAGDIVRYRGDPGGFAEDFGYSQIWRRAASIGGRHSNRGDFCDARLHPLSNAEGSRSEISPAEMLLGFVEENVLGDDCDAQTISFQGKLRFTDGIAIGELTPMPPVALKILDAPKPPSPSLYFKSKNSEHHGMAIRKYALSARQHEIQGRKQYLHAKLLPDGHIANYGVGGVRGDAMGKPPWSTHAVADSEAWNESQRVYACPLPAQSAFCFSIRFDNLTKEELGLLMFSLRPNDAYRHKLGYGKPIGLGTVQLTINSVKLVDRIERYTLLGLTDNPDDVCTILNAERYPQIVDAYANHFGSPEAIHAIRLLGDPKRVGLPVHYPQLSGVDPETQNPYDIESKNFAWFVENEKHMLGDNSGVGVALPPITLGCTTIPHLTRKPRDAPLQPLPNAAVLGARRRA